MITNTTTVVSLTERLLILKCWARCIDCIVTPSRISKSNNIYRGVCNLKKKNYLRFSTDLGQDVFCNHHNTRKEKSCACNFTNSIAFHKKKIFTSCIANLQGKKQAAIKSSIFGHNYLKNTLVNPGGNDVSQLWINVNKWISIHNTKRSLNENV